MESDSEPESDYETESDSEESEPGIAEEFMPDNPEELKSSFQKSVLEIAPQKQNLQKSEYTTM